MSEPERFFFVHLQKTAGTALFQALRQQFGPEAVYPMPEHEAVPSVRTDTGHLREVFERQGDQIKVVAGHFPLCTTELLGVPFTTFTVLRDPFARTLSFLRHRRQSIPELADRSLEELYQDPPVLHGMIHNHMTKMLGLAPGQLRHDFAMLTMVDFDDELVERSRSALERIDVVGLQERFAGFWAELEARFGWDLGEVRVANRTEAGPGDVSAELEAAIRRDNRLDFELYEHAVDLVERRAAG